MGKIEAREALAELRDARKILSDYTLPAALIYLDKGIRALEKAIEKSAQTELAVQDPISSEWSPFVAAFCKQHKVAQGHLNAWLMAYPDPQWISEEMAKANAWLAVNPQRMPKNMARFLGSWLMRGWEKHRKSLPATKGSHGGPKKFLTDEELGR